MYIYIYIYIYICDEDKGDCDDDDEENDTQLDSERLNPNRMISDGFPKLSTLKRICDDITID